MSYEFSEDGLIEQAVEEELLNLGWEVKTAWHNESFGEDGLLGRDNKTEVVLERYLLQAIKKYNPNLPNAVYKKAIDDIVQVDASKTTEQLNKIKYELLRDGVRVTFQNNKGQNETKTLKIFDFEDYHNNHFLAVRQLEISSELYNRRPDVIGFVNGIPLVFMELKAPSVALENTYNENISDYKDHIPNVFHHNAFILLSNGLETKVGTITSPFQYFMEWKRIQEDEEGLVSLDTALKGTCSPQYLMDIFENFLLFDDSGGGVIKLMARNHQFLGVNRVLDNVQNKEDLKGKLGVFWHTQGSGKTYSMAFLTEKINRKLGGAYTFLIVLDRTELENQAYDTFSGVGLVNDKNCIAGKKKGLTGREHLRELLKENHRYVFTLIHKFSIDAESETEYPLITERDNIIVISDEAHRTQGGVYANNMRYFGIPNASYLGFTGTPIIKGEDEITKEIFGEYISIYDFKRAIEDEATLPLLYINRGEKLQIESPVIDDQMAEILEDENLDEDQRRKLTYLFQHQYPVLTAEKRLRAIAKDLVWHFNERGYQGKGMLVTLDKPTAVKMYDFITEYWEEYVVELEKQRDAIDDDMELVAFDRRLKKIKNTEVCVVVSSEQNEISKFQNLGLDIEPHRRKMVERNLEKEFKNEDHPFRLAIVCAMWITGFDAPCVSTIYLDKPIKGHTLMQTIARANRVHDDVKENGLIIDYGNVYTKLEEAYSVYGEGHKSGSKGDRQVVENKDKLVAELKEAIKETETYLRELNFDLQSLADVKPMKRLLAIQKGVEAVSLNEKTRTTFEISARNVFRKYQALFPEVEAKRFSKKKNAISAIYNAINQKTQTADVSQIIAQLQKVVDDNIDITTLGEQEREVIVDLSNLDFEALRRAFEKQPFKNELVYDLNQAVEKMLLKMLRENPLRMKFYERYQEIIKEYNEGKDASNISKSFDDLTKFINELGAEGSRAMREQLDEPTLSIFDLLVKGKNLTRKEIEEVKEVAIKTLKELKEKQLTVQNWKQSRTIKAGVRTTINYNLYHLPEAKYPDAEIETRTKEVYQHIYSYPQEFLSIASGF